MGFNFLLKRGASVALDLGNNNTLITDSLNNHMSAPSFIVLNKANKSIRSTGEEAYDMLGKTSEGFKVIKPLKGGVIADYDAACMLLKTLVKKAYPQYSAFHKFDQLVCGIPFYSSEVERRALRDALEQFRSRKTHLMFEPIAAAIGMGLDVQEPDGKFLVDIGGGITEIALISLSGIVTYRSIKIAGDSFDEDIQHYLRKEYNIIIGIKQAEQLKVSTGAAITLDGDIPSPAYVVGKDAISGIPKGVTISYPELVKVLNDSIVKIEEAILQTLDECPPELAGDIYTNGIYLTGGGSLLRGLKDRLASRLQIHLHQDPHALNSVSNGISKVLRSDKPYRFVLFR